MRARAALLLCDSATVVLLFAAGVFALKDLVFEGTVCYALSALNCAAGRMLVLLPGEPWWRDWRRG